PEGELRRILKRYRALIDASASTVWRAHPDGRIIDSGGWNRQTGQGQEAAEGDGWLDVVHPDDRERALTAWRRMTASGEMGAVEYRARHAGGGYRWILARAVPLKDEFGRIVEWVGVATDVHETRQATETLRIQEERHRLAVLATQDAIWDWDLTTDETEWSEAVDRGFIIRDEAQRAIRMVGAMHDVSRQNEVSSALRSSEERLRLALQAGRMVAWERDLRTGLATRSANAMSLLGIGSGPIALLVDQVHPADRAQVENF
ncbi:PAS domain-containing protein, partial [Sphingomonas sp.]|uniref:PAS domain-containing protein n=1 Tax=Sphingomonas sp. TaxID=28214 RepID=UPI002589A4A1